MQDPIARAYSAWKMSKKMACREHAQRHPTQPCQFPTFAEIVMAEAELLEKQGCAFNRKVCFCARALTIRPSCFVHLLGMLCNSAAVSRARCSLRPGQTATAAR